MSALRLRILGLGKRIVRRTGMRGMLQGMGLLELGRRMHQREVLSSGVHTASLLGRSILFAADTPLDITLLDAPDLDDEKEFIEQLLESMHPDDLVLDVGAHLGMVSLLAGVCGLDRNVRVLAFEPDPVIADRARRSVELNKIDTVEIMAVALGDQDGTIQLALRREAGGNTSSMVIDEEVGETVEVPIRRGDEILRERDLSPNIIKIDIEGAEFLALRGLESCLSTGSVREVFVEVHPKQLGHMGSSPDEIRRWLDTLGFDLVWERPRRTELHWRFTKRGTESTVGG